MHSHAQNNKRQCTAMHRMPKSNARLCTDWQSAMLQTIHDGFQHEQPDYWLNFGNPWEIERLNIAYTIKFYGHVSVQEEGGRQTFRWNPGESVSSPRFAHPFVISCMTRTCAACIILYSCARM